MKMGQKLAKLHRSIYLSLCRADARALLQLGGDIDDFIITNYGNKLSLLHVATLLKHYKTCKFLLENGCNVNFESLPDHRLPIHRSVYLNCPKILQLQIDFGANLDGQGDKCSKVHANPLKSAIKLKLPLMVEISIDNGANYQDLLLESVNKNRKESVNILLENGANVNLSKAIHHGNTLLHVALKGNVSKEIVEIIIRYGAQLNVKDLDGNTPIETALRHENVGMLKICLLKVC